MSSRSTLNSMSPVCSSSVGIQLLNVPATDTVSHSPIHKNVTHVGAGVAPLLDVDDCAGDATAPLMMMGDRWNMAGDVVTTGERSIMYDMPPAGDTRTRGDRHEAVVSGVAVATVLGIAVCGERMTTTGAGVVVGGVATIESSVSSIAGDRVPYPPLVYTGDRPPNPPIVASGVLAIVGMVGLTVAGDLPPKPPDSISSSDDAAIVDGTAVAGDRPPNPAYSSS